MHSNMNNNPQAIQRPLTIWQWNCRSFQSKRISLLHLSQDKKPDVIALQEVDTAPVTLRDYETHVSPASPRTAILVARHLTAQIIDIHSQIGHTFIEILPTSPTTPSIFLLNVYSPPRESTSWGWPRNSHPTANHRNATSRPHSTNHPPPSRP